MEIKEGSQYLETLVIPNTYKLSLISHLQIMNLSFYFEYGVWLLRLPYHH
ncbi:hypothetical protein EV196_107266 [Mariniflexile fucanivorans]|uniref:Uncharacterized protein n=1 Tax=Mariniflexile fucanivorans TaxID=264023 RepID=A0A4R1RF47_9FLAO|nr:hypothetical protein EV196_107266 [Mariniflexile fucanivorans]